MEADLLGGVKDLGSGALQMVHGVTTFAARAADRVAGVVEAVVDEVTHDANDDKSIECMRYVDVDAAYGEGIMGIVSGVGRDVTGMAVGFGSEVGGALTSTVSGVGNMATGKLGGAANSGMQTAAAAIRTVGTVSSGFRTIGNVLDAVGKMAKGDYEQTHRRQPRFFDIDGVMSQYSAHEAQGQAIVLRHRLFESGEMCVVLCAL